MWRSTQAGVALLVAAGLAVAPACAIADNPTEDAYSGPAGQQEQVLPPPTTPTTPPTSGGSGTTVIAPATSTPAPTATTPTAPTAPAPKGGVLPIRVQSKTTPAAPTGTAAVPVSSKGSLPFTGRDLRITLLIGLALLGTGLALRRALRSDQR
jgi:hypothetical protein